MARTNSKIPGGHYSAYLKKVARFYQRKEVKIYVNLILSLVAISFFAFFAIRPTVITIAGLIKEVDDQKIVLEKLDRKIEDLAEAKKNFSELESDLHLITEALPSNPDLWLFVAQIETLAQKYELKIESLGTKRILLKGKVKPGESQKTAKTPHPSFQTSLSLSGDYKNLSSFLESLDNLRRINNIGTVAINKMGRSGTKLSLSLRIDAYYLAGD